MPAESGAGGEILYEERHSFPWWIHVLMLGLLVLYTLAIVYAVKRGRWSLTEYFISAAVVLLILTYINFFILVFKITGQQVVFGFGVFKKRMERSLLVSCEPFRLEFANYGGYGIRWGRDGTIAYNARNGPGVRMVFKGSKRPYVVSIDGVGRVCEMLSSPGGPAAG